MPPKKMKTGKKVAKEQLISNTMPDQQSPAQPISEER